MPSVLLGPKGVRHGFTTVKKTMEPRWNIDQSVWLERKGLWKWKPPGRKIFILCRIQENKLESIFNFPHYIEWQVGCSLFAKDPSKLLLNFFNIEFCLVWASETTFFASRSALLFLAVILELHFGYLWQWMTATSSPVLITSMRCKISALYLFLLVSSWRIVA